MKTAVAWCVAAWGLFALLIMSGCVTQEPAWKVKNTLTPEKQAYFSDSFDTLRRDIWEKAGLIYSEDQQERFKLAEPRVQGGEVVIETGTGCFSKGGLATTFRLTGDFDIQLGCRMSFPENPPKEDWIAIFGVFEGGGRIGDVDGVQVGLVRKELQLKSYVFSNYFANGVLHRDRGSSSEIEAFDGAFRLVRRESRVTALYRQQGDSGWSELGTHPFTDGEAFVGFKVQNFLAFETHVQASSPVRATFDDFRINAAGGIVESEI